MCRSKARRRVAEPPWWLQSRPRVEFTGHGADAVDEPGQVPEPDRRQECCEDAERGGGDRQGSGVDWHDASVSSQCQTQSSVHVGTTGTAMARFEASAFRQRHEEILGQPGGLEIWFMRLVPITVTSIRIKSGTHSKSTATAGFVSRVRPPGLSNALIERSKHPVVEIMPRLNWLPMKAELAWTFVSQGNALMAVRQSDLPWRCHGPGRC